MWIIGVVILLELLFIVALFVDKYDYEKGLLTYEQRIKARKEAEERKKPKEFKWPDDVPHVF